jgi:hypothetical protein
MIIKFFIHPLFQVIMSTGMAEDDVQVESAAGELTSGMQESSIRMMKAAYLSTPAKKEGAAFGVPFFKTPSLHKDEEVPGPGARVYITKITNRTPDNEIIRIISPAAEREVVSRTHDFYTFLFYVNIHLDEPSTTRFINAIVSFILSPGNKVLDYSPKEKETITNIAKTAGEEIFLSPALDISAFPLQYSEGPDDPESRFEIRIGPEEKIPVTYSKKQGYSLVVPKYMLLEYEGMRQNEHEVYWEIYPPMPPNDSEITGKGKHHAIFSLLVQAPRASPPEVTVRITGKVKGEIWGVVQLKGVLDF